MRTSGQCCFTGDVPAPLLTVPHCGHWGMCLPTPSVCIIARTTNAVQCLRRRWSVRTSADCSTPFYCNTCRLPSAAALVSLPSISTLTFAEGVVRLAAPAFLPRWQQARSRAERCAIGTSTQLLVLLVTRLAPAMPSFSALAGGVGCLTQLASERWPRLMASAPPWNGRGVPKAND